MKATRTFRAFTLVDLVAVLAVITVLACLMIPAFARSTTQTSISQCAANIKQAVQGTLLFAADNNDKLQGFGPVGTGGHWPWDLSSGTEYAMESYGVHRAQYYDPGFPQQNIDLMWNYSVVYSGGVPVAGGSRATGYSYTSGGGTRVESDDQNSSISTQVITLVGNDPSLTATIPALSGNQLKIQPSRRVLVADAIVSDTPGGTDPSQAGSYNWHNETASGIITGAWRNTPYGPWKGSSSPHLNTALLPSGANEGMLDGRVKWYPWSTNFVVCTDPNPCLFWLLTNPAKL